MRTCLHSNAAVRPPRIRSEHAAKNGESNYCLAGGRFDPPSQRLMASPKNEMNVRNNKSEISMFALNFRYDRYPGELMLLGAE